MEISTIVIDNGTSSMRAGFGGDKDPMCIIPTVVGHPKQKKANSVELVVKDNYIGSEISQNAQNITLHSPITNRIITNFDDMEKLWSHLFKTEMNVDMKDHPVLMTETPLNDKKARERTTEIFMDTFEVPAFYLIYPENLSLYSIGLTTGTVMDFGETTTQILPIYECYGIDYLTKNLEIGGRQISMYLKNELKKTGIELPQEKEKEYLKKLKEQYCFVSSNYEEEKLKSTTKSIQIGDGELELSHQLFYPAETLFNPALEEVKSPGILELFNEVYKDVDDDIKSKVCSSLMVSGGSSLFQGLPERLKLELDKGEIKPKLYSPEKRRFSAWIGGSIMVSLSTFSQMWISQAEYKEVGPEIVNLKCF